MKKISVFLVWMVLCLTIVGCGGSNKDTSKKSKKKEFITEDQIDDMYSDPDKFIGKYVVLKGQLNGSPESSDDKRGFQMWGNPETLERNTVVYCDKSLAKDLKGDSYVIVTGKIEGSFEGENAFGKVINTPKITADKIEISNYIDVISPTLKSVDINDVRNSNGVTVTLQKVEFSQIETRIYLSIDNQSGKEYSFYSYNSKIVQNGKQFELGSNYYAEYPELSSDILSGVKSEGILVFDKLEQANFQLVCEGQSDDYSLDGDVFTFDINIQ